MTTLRVSTLSPPLLSLSSKSSLSGWSGFRRAEKRSTATLRVSVPTESVRSGRLPPGQPSQLGWVPSVSSHCSLSLRSRPAGGGCGGLRPAPWVSVAVLASLSGPRLCQGSLSVRTSSSAPGIPTSSDRACAKPSAKRVPWASRVSRLTESSTHSVMSGHCRGSCGSASAVSTRAVSSARRRQAGSGGRRWPAAAGLAAAPRHRPRWATGSASRWRPPRCSQRIAGSSTSPTSQTGVTQLNNVIAPGPGDPAACAATAARCPSR